MPANNQPDLGNLDACIQDASDALLDSAGSTSTDPATYQEALTRLRATRDKLPPLYQDAALDPLLTYLQDSVTDAAYANLLAAPSRPDARFFFSCVQALLQHGEAKAPGTSAFQEVVSDLYDGFLSEEDRRGVKSPDHSVAAPLVVWRKSTRGPYSFKSEQTGDQFGLKVGVINLPPSHVSKGLMGWGLLGHEAAGHEILSADDGLLKELKTNIDAAFPNDGSLAQYWKDKLEETAADVMGVLNMGPAAAIGFLGYFRGLNQDGRLSSEDTSDHPPDIMRGYLAAATVRLLTFSGGQAWAQEIEKQTDNDFSGPFTLDDSTVDARRAKELAGIVAGVIATSKLDALEQHSLQQIQDWDDDDQQIADALAGALKADAQLSEIAMDGIYAAHMVAAAISLAAAEADPQKVLKRTIDLLKKMHARNPCWGPLLVEHPGAVEPDYAFSRPQRTALLRARRRRKKQT